MLFCTSKFLTSVAIAFPSSQETQGVCVATLGPTRDFPSFFTARSGFQSPHRVADADAAAALIECQRGLGLDSGLLLANPIPEAAAAEGEAIERAIQQVQLVSWRSQKHHQP